MAKVLIATYSWSGSTKRVAAQQEDKYILSLGYLIANSRTIGLINQDVTKVVALYNGDVPLHQKYYAYWKKDNSGYYIEEFANILKDQF